MGSHTMENGETSGETERRWRKALQKIGVVAVRQKLQHLIDDDTASTKRSGSRTSLSNPPRQFIDAWYRDAQQQAQRAKNSRAYLLAAIALAMVATGIIFLIVQ